MPSISINYVKVRETKNAIRYEMLDETHNIIQDISDAELYDKSLYIKKWVFEESAIPNGITMELSW